MSDIEPLRAALGHAVVRRAALEAQRDKERESRIVAIDADLRERYGSDILSAAGAERVAREAVEDAEIEAGLAELAALPWREFAEWKSERYLMRPQPKPTGRTGSVEVRTRQTMFAENAAGWTLPRFGELFLRINKKDGNPGLQFDRYWRPGSTHAWRPITSTPKATP